jgi:hypothetical protein
MDWVLMLKSYVKKIFRDKRLVGIRFVTSGLKNRRGGNFLWKT